MTCTEDQFRWALRTVAADFTEASLPPLDLPADQLARRPRMRAEVTGPRWRRWLIPLTAAAAVTVIAVAATVIGDGGKAPQPGAPAKPGASAPTLWHGVPSYYFVVTSLTGRPPRGTRTELVVRQTSTGSALASLRSPKGCQFGEVSAAADDQTVALACMVGNYYRGTARLYRARFDPATDRLSLSALHFPQIHGFQALALSQDGSRIAVTWATGPFGPTATSALRVYTIGGTVLRTWRGPGEIMPWPWGQVVSDWSLGDLWWGPGSSLAFNYLGPDQNASGVRLLSSSGPSGSLTAASRLVVPEYEPNGYQLAGTTLSGNGAAVPAVLFRQRGNNADLEFADFATATGRMLREWRRVVDAEESVIWSNSSGNTLVVVAPSRIGRSGTALGIMAGTRFSPLEPEPPFSWLDIVF